MTTPTPSGSAEDRPRVDLGKSTGHDAAHGAAHHDAAHDGAGTPSGRAADDASFDPYRFGRPEQPVPPEFAPPGYVPDPPTSAPPPGPYAPGGYPPPQGQHGPPGGYAAPPSGYGPYGAPGQQPYGAPGQGPYGAAGPGPYGYQPPQHQGYGPYPGYGAPTGNNGKAVTAMVLGIASIPLFFLTFLDLALIIPALVFGILGLREARRRNGTGRSQAIAGLVCLVVGTIAATVFSVWLFTRVGSCEHYARDGDQAGYNSCVQDRFR